MPRRRLIGLRRGAQSHEFTILFDLYAASNLGETLIDEILAPAGLSDGYALLSAVRALGPITPTEAAARVGMPITTASDKIKRLRERGLVRRISNPDDGRSQLLTITAKGERAWNATRPSFEELVQQLERNLRLPRNEVRRVVVELDRALRQTLEEVRLVGGKRGREARVSLASKGRPPSD